jgi:hypothetical protein
LESFVKARQWPRDFSSKITTFRKTASATVSRTPQVFHLLRDTPFPKLSLSCGGPREGFHGVTMMSVAQSATSTIILDGWMATARVVVTGEGVYLLLGKSYRCDAVGCKTKSFNNLNSVVLNQLPSFILNQLPIFLTEKSGIEK